MAPVDHESRARRHHATGREECMRGLMMDQPLLITNLIRYAAQYHADTEIVTRTVEGPSACSKASASVCKTSVQLPAVPMANS